MSEASVNNPFGVTPMSEDQKERYYAAAHAVQAGTKLGETSAMDCRIGLNITQTEFAFVTQLLVAKGLITENELYETLIKANLAEKARLEEELTAKFGGGPKITLV